MLLALVASGSYVATKVSPDAERSIRGFGTRPILIITHTHSHPDIRIGQKTAKQFSDCARLSI